MNRIALLVQFLLGLLLAGGCLSTSTPPPPSLNNSPAPSAIDLETRHQRISQFIGEDKYGPGGQVVLGVAYHALKEKHEAGEGLLVGLEDLWAHSLQEGLALFNKPDVLWGRTTAEETADMIGQTTIGPWQLTVSNIRHVYGPRYGIDPAWPEARVYTFCRDHPDIQAKMIIDYIQLSYETFGVRSPYAIQRYFWLDPFVKGEIGQSPDWTRSVLAKPPPDGSWKDLTAEQKANTGFYAKQILMGTSYTDSGMLFWLWITGDIEGIHAALRTWRDQPRVTAGGDPASPRTITLGDARYTLTGKPGGFTVHPEDVRYYRAHPEAQDAIRSLIIEIEKENQ